MKFLIIASLVAFVAAEAESDPTHHFGTHLTKGFVRYPNGAIVPQDTASVQLAKGLHLNAKALIHPYHLLPKAVVPSIAVPITKTTEDADAPDTQKVITYATPTYPFYSGYPLMAPYKYPTTYGAYPYTTPYTTHTGLAPYHHLIKREAEAEAEADPALVYHHGGPHLTTHKYQYGYPSYPYGYPTTMGYNVPRVAVPITKTTTDADAPDTQKAITYATPTYPFYSGYPYVAPYKYPTTYGAYPYTTPYTTHTGLAPYHHLIKREAEAEAEADPALVYHHGGPHLTTHNYQYGYPTYPYGYPTTMHMGYNGYPYKYPFTYGAYPYTAHTRVAPIYTAPLTHIPASTTKLVRNVMPLAPKLF